MVEYKNHDFEGPGGLTEWDYATGNAQLSTAQKHSGLQSFLSSDTGTTACYVRDNVTYDEVYVNFWVRFSNLSWATNGKSALLSEIRHSLGMLAGVGVTGVGSYKRWTIWWRNGATEMNDYYPYSAISTDTWYNVELYFKRNVIVKFWINGTIYMSKPITTTYSVTPTQWRLGYEPWSGGNPNTHTEYLDDAILSDAGGAFFHDEFPNGWSIRSDGEDATPFLLDAYWNIKHTFYHSGVYFCIYASYDDETDIKWAYSTDGEHYIFGGVIYWWYGSGNEFHTWYDAANSKVYLYHIDWDLEGHAVSIGTISGTTITWSEPSNIETTYRWLSGITKTSNGRLWAMYAHRSDQSQPYQLFIRYSDNEGATWSSEQSISATSHESQACSSLAPFTSDSIYVYYQDSGGGKPYKGRTWNGTSLGSVESPELGDGIMPAPIVIDTGGRIHLIGCDDSAGIIVNWRSPGPSGTWQTNWIQLRGTAYLSHGHQLTMSTTGGVLAFIVDYNAYIDPPRRTLYYYVFDSTSQTWGSEVEVGLVEHSTTYDSYYNSSFRSPYQYDGNTDHLALTWQVFDQGWSYTFMAAGTGIPPYSPPIITKSLVEAIILSPWIHGVRGYYALILTDSLQTRLFQFLEFLGDVYATIKLTNRYRLGATVRLLDRYVIHGTIKLGRYVQKFKDRIRRGSG